MAVRMAAATGNWLTAGTWGLVDATSYLNSETGAQILTTSYVASSSFTPGAITVDGVAVKLSNRTGITGTISLHLAIAGVEVVGTLVTLNTADLPAGVTADLNGGWVFFKFASPVLLLAATAYTLELKTSSASMVTLFRDGTAGNYSRALRTTATGAPGAGDDVIVCGEYTGAGTSNTLTVTMDAIESSILDYGAASTSLVTPAIAICTKGILRFGATAATAYYLRVSGCVIVYAGGELDMGTVATPIPRDSTARLNFDCGAAVDFGLTVRNLGTFIAQGLSRTSGKNVYVCKLNTDEAIASTSLGVDTDTGWLDNDEIAVASTTQTPGNSENGTMNGNAGASALTVDGFTGAGGGLAVAHSGTAPTQAEVILLTRNVQIFGASASLSAYIDLKATATVDADWTEFKWLGSATANKRGIDTACTTGVQSFQYCSRHTSTISNSMGWRMSGASGTGLTIANCVTFNVANNHVFVFGSTGFCVIDSNVFMRCTDAVALVDLADIGATVTNNTFTGSVGNGINVSEGGGAILGSFSGNTMHSNGGIGINFGGAQGGAALSTVFNTTIWRNGGGGIVFGNTFTNLLLLTLTMFGNGVNNITVSYPQNNFVIDGLTANGDTTFATTNGINFNGGGTSARVFLLNSNLGTSGGIKIAHTNDLAISTGMFLDMVLMNTLLASPVELTGQNTLHIGSAIGAQKHDQTTGLHKTWKRQGTIAIETVTVHTGSQSMSLTPISGATSTSKLESSSFLVAVASGATVTPTAWIQKSAAYNGNQPRLVLKRNDAIGIAADTVIATYASGTGSWNSISGVTPAATDDGVMEFVIDCDFGTGGVVYVDSLSAA